jgi:Cdc6-like AAA superfamily ATPase
MRSPEYEDWKTGSTRFLWLHGIPGAGKTVLSSFIVEDLKRHCKSDATRLTACAYYYCHFSRSQDETSHFLRWVINQVCRQSDSLPMEVRQLYKESGQPSTESLLVALSAATCDLERIYVVIDALDESSDRHRLLGGLRRIINGDEFANLRILGASRKEIDIQKTFTKEFCGTYPPKRRQLPIELSNG